MSANENGRRSSGRVDVAFVMNDYKWSFLRRRYLETLLGGLRLFSENELVWSAKMFQISLWLLFPAVVLIFALFSVFGVTVSGAEGYLVFILCGAANLALFVVLQIVFSVGRNSSDSIVLANGKHNSALSMLVDDDPDVDSLWSSSAFASLFPKRRWFQIAALGMLLTGVSGVSCRFLAFAVLEQSWWFVATGFLSLAVCMYSAVGRCPVEIAVLCAEDPIGFNMVSRLCYALAVCFFPDSFVAHVVFAAFPLLFALGLLPSVDVFVLWACEQSLVHAFGGSYASSDLVLVAQSLLSGGCIVMLVFVQPFLSHGGFLFLCVLVGVILSSQIVSKATAVLIGLQTNANQMTGDSISKYSLFQVATWLYVGLAAAGLVLFESSSFSASPNSTLALIFGSIALFCAVFGQIVMAHATCATSVFSLVSHPFVEASSATKNVCRIALQIAAHVSCVGFVFAAVQSGSKAWLSVIFIARAARQPFQSSRISQLEVSLVFLVYCLGGQLVWAPVEYLLFFAGLFVSRSAELYRKCSFMWLHWWTTVSEKKMRFHGYLVALGLQFLFFPIFVAFLVLSVILSVPLLPVFGVALFVSSSPRTRKQFPGGRMRIEHSADATYYAALAPSLMRSISTACELDAGQTLLLREDANIVLLEVLEVGLGYAVVCLKGLEFQTTSCHAVEATEIDSLLEETQTVANPIGGSRSFMLNHKWFHTTTPISLLRTEGYSTSASKVDSVLQNPEVLEKTFPDAFTLVLAFLLSKQGHAASQWLSSKPADAEDLVEDRTKLTDDIRALLSTLGNPLDGLKDQMEGDRSRAIPAAPSFKKAEKEKEDEELEDILSWVVQRNSSKPVSSAVPLKKPASLNTGEMLFEMICRAVDLPHATTPYHLHKLFSGSLPYSPYRDWVEKHNHLRSLVLNAVRYSVKIAMDQFLMVGPSDSEELFQVLGEYQTDWFFGVSSAPEWASEISKGTPNLFSLSSPTDAILCSRQKLVFSVASINRECVRSIWSALAMELLYATNDDDERYSIQAHKRLLRNILVQAADPPLGYPVYSSGGCIVPL
eukprot:ANDGO_07941.mRNA.1 Protein pecanex